MSLFLFFNGSPSAHSFFFLVGYHQRFHRGASILNTLNFPYYFPNPLALVRYNTCIPRYSSLPLLQTHNENHQFVNPEIQGHSLPLTIQYPKSESCFTREFQYNDIPPEMGQMEPVRVLPLLPESH